jgi:hypothetical protein
MSSISERWTVCVAVALALCAAGCGDDDAPEEPAPRTTVAEALTRGVRFDNGTVRLGEIGDASNERVKLSPTEPRLQLSPDQSSTMSLAVDNSDAVKVNAMLLQFGDAESHVEVARIVEPSAAPVTVELDYTVDDAICAQLCAAELEVTLLPAATLENGEIARGEPLTVTLDCREAGDPERCPEALPDAAAPDAAAPADAGVADLDALASQLGDALGAVHDAFCTNCGDPNRVPCYAVAPTNSIACIETAIRGEQGDLALRERLAELVAAVQAAQPRCEACDLEACSPTLLTDALPDLTDELAAAIQTCVDR